jgi:hypothetical protein
MILAYASAKAGALPAEEETMQQGEHESMAQARRRFLASCGRFAALTPPAVTLLLSAADATYAVAASGRGGGSSAASAARAGGPRGNNGFGNGGFDGSPNGKQDITR